MEESFGHVVEVSGRELAEHFELFLLHRLEDKLLVMRREEAHRSLSS